MARVVDIVCLDMLSQVVVCLEVPAVLEVSGHVGGEVSILCSANWTTDSSSKQYSMYFCKGVCSRGNTIIEATGMAVKPRGRYSMEVNRGGAFTVTVRKLKRSDAGRYRCGMGETFDVLYQEVNLIVLNASVVPPGPPPSATTLQTEAETLPQASLISSTSLATESLSVAEEETNHKAATMLTDTTVVIIISVSLALVVCAVIPLMFYRHYWTNSEGQNKPEATVGEADCCEPSPDELSVHDASQYAAIYQALDPKSLD